MSSTLQTRNDTLFKNHNPKEVVKVALYILVNVVILVVLGLIARFFSK